MRLGDSQCTHNAPDYRQLLGDDASRLLNEATLRKLMRVQPIKSGHQYWIHFSDAQSLWHCVEKRGVPLSIEEKAVDRFTLGLDWLSNMLRTLNSWQVAVVVAIDESPLLVCTFLVS
jgi:hypothetical protein